MLVRSFAVVGSDDPVLLEAGIKVVLVIDSAGKVRSAVPIGNMSTTNLDLMSALSQWKFIPAFKDHRPVASTMVKIFSPKQ